MAYSGDFSSDKFGIQWRFFRGDINGENRVRLVDGALGLRGKGNSPSNSSGVMNLRPTLHAVGNRKIPFRNIKYRAPVTDHHSE